MILAEVMYDPSGPDGGCAQVTPLTVPIDAVIYGDTNVNGLIDETGMINPPDVGYGTHGRACSEH